MNKYVERTIITHTLLHGDCDCNLCEWCGGAKGLIESYPLETFTHYRKEWAWVRQNYKQGVQVVDNDPTAPNLTRLMCIMARNTPKGCVSIKCVLLEIPCQCILNLSTKRT